MQKHGVKSLYPLALAEGEGIGTAYEYVAKRNVLQRWLKHRPSGKLLVAGLPEVYGASLDYMLLAEEFNMPVLIVDDRPQHLDKAEHSWRQAQGVGLLSRIHADFALVADPSQLAEINYEFDWCICNEVLQRFDDAGKERYVRRLMALAPLVTLFAPNAENDSHTTVSGLSGLKLSQMQALLKEVAAIDVATGFCDMPPFPPGVSRSEAQRAQAGHGRMEAMAMWGLSRYAGFERFLPQRFKRNRAHIVYGLARIVS